VSDKPFLRYTKQEAKRVPPVPKLLAMTWLEDLNARSAEIRSLHRRIEHLTARMRYWRTQATGYPDSRQQREARRKG
jgi:hypothetical protein